MRKSLRTLRLIFFTTDYTDYTDFQKSIAMNPKP
jgi:hypothetical protein